MNSSLPTTNPFASVHIRPAAMPFLFRSGESAAQLIDRLRASAWRGQIIGPHGTGKSTLLAKLLPLIEAEGWRIVRVALPGRELDESPTQVDGETTATMVYVIDGFEQLSAAQRLAWRLYCWWRECGLLVTAHRDLGLPTVHTNNVDAGLAQRVVDTLLRGDARVISAADVTQALHANRGNLRDALFALYDVYELRRVANMQHQVSEH